MIRQAHSDDRGHRVVMTDPCEALLRAAACRLADTMAPYRVLTRQRLVALSGATRWRSVGFEDAVTWGIENDVLRWLGGDLYELPLRHENA